jgi:AcrR family transcriptional regulator
MKEKLTSRDIQAQETREKLLRTSMELIAKEGYRNVTISRICKECGVSVGTFYQYFGAKRDIIVLMDREHNEYLSTACQLDGARSARQLYLDFVEKYMERIEDSGLALSKSLMLGQLEDNVGDDEAGVHLQREFLGKVLAHGRRTGEFSSKAMKDEEFFEVFSVTINGILITWFLNHESIDLKPYGCKHLGRLLELLVD